jgi:hypothetical protein
MLYFTAAPTSAVKVRAGKNAVLRYAKMPSKCFVSGYEKITVNLLSPFSLMREAVG